MTFPLDASGEGAPYSESLRTVDTNPTSVFTPVGQVMAERTILVAEDDTNTRRALQHYLKRSGYEVTGGGQRGRVAGGGLRPTG